MKICEIKAFKGRNIYSHQKVIKMVVDLEDMVDVATKDIEGFNDALLKLLPGLYQHHCSLGCPGGFIARLEEGTYLSHVIEHCALEIQSILGYDVSFGRARQVMDSTKYTIVYAYKNEVAGVEAGKCAVQLVEALCKGHSFDLSSHLNRIKEKAVKNELGPSTKAIVEAALGRGIPVMRIGNGSILQLGYGKYQKRIEATITENTSCISVDIACDKTLTKEILKEAGIPVPEGSVCTTIEDALQIAEELGYPVVIKPEKGNQGKGVSLNLTTPEEVVQAFKIARQVDENIIVEKYIKGNDYRVLVVGGRVVAVAQRIPAHVVGDGVHTIAQLVEMVNKDERRGEGHEKPLTKIKIDEISLMLLKKQGYTLDSIPPAGKWVYLKANGNLSTGGEAIDCTNKIHPVNCEIAVRAAQIIGLDIAGIDIACPDISKPIEEGVGAVIEVNAAPGIRMHLYPSKGKPRNVAQNIIDMLFPPGSRHSIPIISVTGTNGKTTTVRMIAHILRTQGYTVGMTTTGGVYINDHCVMKGDTTGPASAKIVLTDKRVEVAVLETARGGIIRSGLGYDLSDIAVLTNISEDHLGIDEVYTLEDLLHVKSLVVEAVKTNGYVVLNADDPMVVEAAKRVKSNIIYFSKQEDNIIVHRHLVAGGLAVFLKGQHITIATGDGFIQCMDVSRIPATYGGKLVYNIENSLAAVSVAYAMKIPIETIQKALASFYADEIHNPGRFNVFNIRDFRVVVDYAHNISGYTHVIEAIKKMGASRTVGIIGVPGDRQDSSIRRIGFIAGKGFDRVIIKEDVDLRGRRRGEVAKLLEEGVLSAGMDPNNVEVILSEVEALKTAIKRAKTGDLIVIFYEKLEPIMATIKEVLSNVEAETTSDENHMMLGLTRL
ncbi:cyanophycin synthetase [Caldicoprobacter guelmensis]|uniref:cyanophycin synthetase n=1 Tax=Caldicoprobacter guelmensis TaxID=1170224 RepID=UPI00195928E2|nr:cyanophycin synthetase [Caldicoprobacter guelmensis]MBM7581509.1 cyanophycin synthetase [Caldicoprobacter guelmensis]